MPKSNLSIDLVSRWVQLYHQRTGCWPSQLSGHIPEAVGVTWRQIDQAFRHGRRGLPGGTSLSRFLAEKFGIRPKQSRSRSQLEVSRILSWAQHHWLRTGRWPIAESGPIEGIACESWRRVDSALKYGLRGLPSCGSLRRLIDDYRRTYEGITMDTNQLKPKESAPNQPPRYTPIQVYEVMNRVAAAKLEGKAEEQTVKELGLPRYIVGRWRSKYGASWLDSLQKLNSVLSENRSLHHRLKRLEADCKLKSKALHYALPGPHSRRRCVEHLVHTQGVAVGTACRAIGQNPSTQGNVPRAKRPLKLEHAIEEMSRRHPQYGIARIQALLSQDGWQVSMNTVATIRRRLHLAPAPRQRHSKRRRHGLGSCSVLPARERDQIWTYDILHDRDINGQRYKILGILDEFTRECLSLVPGRRIRSYDVAHELLILILRRGVPEGIRSDNAKELVAGRVRGVLRSSGIRSIVVTRASPWENAHVESFFSNLRVELLNEVALGSMKEYRNMLQSWKENYNNLRPHHALGHMTPSAFAAGHASAINTGEQVSPKPIHMHPMKSKWIRALGYDTDALVMQVRFVSGEVFRYFGVSAEEYTRLATSPVPGRYFRERFVRVGGLSEGRVIGS